MKNTDNADYWKRNIRLILFCLSIWFMVSFVFGILMVEQLNQIRIGGFQLGFWFSQQGSICFFIVLIFVYVFRMNKLDREFGVEEEDEE